MHTTDTTTHRPTSHRSDRHRRTSHQPSCPAAGGQTSPVAACTVAAHPEQGWSLLCNGVVLFDDGGYLLPATPSTVPASQPVAA
jgi:hypothetical protein